MALRGDPRILLVFSILACNTKINNFFAPHSSSKMPETGAAYIKSFWGAQSSKTWTTLPGLFLCCLSTGGEVP
jgi:hypothetical protein